MTEALLTEVRVILNGSSVRFCGVADTQAIQNLLDQGFCRGGTSCLLSDEDPRASVPLMYLNGSWPFRGGETVGSWVGTDGYTYEVNNPCYFVYNSRVNLTPYSNVNSKDLLKNIYWARSYLSFTEALVSENILIAKSTREVFIESELGMLMEKCEPGAVFYDGQGIEVFKAMNTKPLKFDPTIKTNQRFVRRVDVPLP